MYFWVWNIQIVILSGSSPSVCYENEIFLLKSFYVQQYRKKKKTLVIWENKALFLKDKELRPEAQNSQNVVSSGLESFERRRIVRSCSRSQAKAYIGL